MKRENKTYLSLDLEKQYQESDIREGTELKKLH